MHSRAALVTIVLGLSGCALVGCASGGSGGGSPSGNGGGDRAGTVPQAKPQVIEPAAGVQAGLAPGGGSASDPVGDVNAHAPPLSQVRHELRLELVAAPVTNASYVDPLRFVTSWERTDQGVDAGMPVGGRGHEPDRKSVV